MKRLATLTQTDRFVDANGLPTRDALRTVNELIQRQNALGAQYALEASYPSDFTPPFIEADDLGNVTIAPHFRTYGDGSLVSVDGDTLATGEAPLTVVYVYYDDVLQRGGAVTYAYSLTPPIQAGARHVVGKVEIPVAGTATGTYLQPPGYLP